MNKDYMYFYTKVSGANISPTARSVYRALLQSCFPSVNTLSRDTGLSSRTIRRSLQVLEKEELILRIHRTRENNGNTSNMYFLN